MMQGGKLGTSEFKRERQGADRPDSTGGWVGEAGEAVTGLCQDFTGRQAVV